MAKASGTDLAGFNAPAGDHLPVLARRRRPLPPRQTPDLVTKMDLVRKFSFEPRPARRGREVGRRGRHRVPGRQDAGQCEEHQDALRRHLHEAGGGRQALGANAGSVRRLINQRPGAAKASRSGCCRSSALLLLYVFASQLRLAENAERQAAAVARQHRRRPFTTYAFDGRSRAAAGTCSGRIPGPACKRIGIALLISAALGLLLAIAIGVVPRTARAAVAAARPPSR